MNDHVAVDTARTAHDAPAVVITHAAVTIDRIDAAAAAGEPRRQPAARAGSKVDTAVDGAPGYATEETGRVRDDARDRARAATPVPPAVGPVIMLAIPPPPAPAGSPAS